MPPTRSPSDPPGGARIVALIPAYNEADRVGAVVAAAVRHLPVIVVDDGSADATAEAAEKAGAQVLRQGPNQGKGAALRAGFRHALEVGHAAVLTLDADGQHDPAEIPKFLKAFSRGDGPACDLLVGERDFRKMPLVRRLSNAFARWSFSRALGQPIRDNQSGYRLISRRLLGELLESDEQGFEFEVEMFVTCLGRGMTLGWVPIRTIYAGEGSHIHPIKHTLNFIRIVLRSRRRLAELKAQS